jgi:hypothetical protein
LVGAAMYVAPASAAPRAGVESLERAAVGASRVAVGAAVGASRVVAEAAGAAVVAGVDQADSFFITIYSP